MGSNYFGGEPNYMGNARGAGLSPSSSSSSPSRKGKKNSSDKPKQPQRGLGVAQLEKIRLHSQLGSNYLPSVHSPYASSFNQEDMRLQSTGHSSSSSSFSYSSSISSPSYGFQGHHGVMMGFPDLDNRANIKHGDSQYSSNIPRLHPGNAAYGTQHFHVEPNRTRSFLEQDTLNKTNKKDWNDFMGFSSQNTDPADSSEDIDLELRLSR